MDLQSNRGRAIIIGVVALVLIVIGAIVFMPRSSNQTTPSSDQGESSEAEEITYEGTDKMIDLGLADTQLKDFKFGLYRYTKSINLTPKIVSVFNIDHVHDTHAPVVDYMTFDMTINRAKSYKGRLEFSGLFVARLYLSDSLTNKPLFDSGDIEVDHTE